MKRKKNRIIKKIPSQLFFYIFGFLFREKIERDDQCPWCSYSDFDPGHGEFYCVEDSGTSFNGDYMVWWCQGTQTCPRCLHEFTYDMTSD
jgi:hypothetical protein